MSVVKLTQDNWNEKLSGHEGPIIIDFYADWCGPCVKMKPIMEAISMRKDILVGKVNVDEEAKLKELFSIQSIPTFVIYKDGSNPSDSKIVTGAMSQEDLLALVE